MATQVATRASGGALAAAQALRKNLAVFVQTMPESGGKQFLRFLQDGNWVFGQSNEEISKGKDELALNPLSIRIGWSCWSDHDKASGKKNELIDERTVALGQPPILGIDLPDHSPWEWRELVQCDFKVLTGKHKGKQITYNPTSMGGVGMMRALMEQVLIQLEEDELNIVPVVVLDSAHYMHKKWGRTYTPEFEIVEFVSIDGEAMSAPEPEEEPEEKPKRTSRAAKPEPEAEEDEAPRRRSRAAKAEEPEEEPEQGPEQNPEAEEADEAPRRRRRR